MTASSPTRSCAAVAGRPPCWPKWRRLMRDPRSARAWRRYRDVAELLAGATERTVLEEVPGKSGATLERVVIGGQGYVLKHLDLAEDWTMRASGCLRADHTGPACAVPAAHGRPARGVLGVRERVRCGPRHAPLPGAFAVDSDGGGRRWLGAPGPAAGREGLAAAGRGRSRRGRGGHPAGARPWSAGGGPGRDTADVRAQQLEARQPRYGRHRANGGARLGTARARRAAQRPGLVPRDQLPPPAPVEGGLDRGLPGSARGLRHRHRNMVGTPAGPVPAGRHGPVRLGEGTRRL